MNLFKHTRSDMTHKPCPTQAEVDACLPHALDAADASWQANARNVGVVDVRRLVAYVFISSLPDGTTKEQIADSIHKDNWVRPKYRAALAGEVSIG